MNIKKMNTIGIIDTTICDNNLGNFIIMDAVYKHLRDIFQNDFFIKLPYLDDFSDNMLRYMEQCKYVFVGGTNLLSSQMDCFKQIGLTKDNSKEVANKLVLLGVGWWQYQGCINGYTEDVLNNALSKTCIHSVRDKYTESKLKSIGITNVIHTGCPSMWGLTKEKCKKIRKSKSAEKGGKAIVSFTDYNRNYERDRLLFDIVSRNYREVYAWIQGPSDYEYISNMGKVEFIPPRLDALHSFMKSTEVDYIGLRLHMGIFSLQHNQRSIIIGIDNRAIEMKKSYNLPVVEENRIEDELEGAIYNEQPNSITVPMDNIRIWKNQFENNMIDKY